MPDICRQAPISTVFKPSPTRGRGTALAVDEVPTQAPDFIVSLSIALDSDLTANPIIALTRGAGECRMSVGSRCPRLESVRRGKPLQPTPRCREAVGTHFRGGDGFRPAGLMFRGLDLQYRGLFPIETSSTANAVPLLLQGEGLNDASRGERMLKYRAPLTPLSTLHSPLCLFGEGGPLRGG